MHTGGVVMVGIVGALVGFGIGAVQFIAKDSGGPSKAEAENITLRERLASLESASRAEKTATLDTVQHQRALEADLASSKDRLVAADKRIAELTAAAAMGEHAATGTADGKEAKDPQSAKKAKFPYKDFDGALAEIDWASVGTSMSGMAPLLVTLGDVLSKGGDLPPDVVGRIQQLNGPLVAVALKLLAKKVAGTDANGAFTNPLFMVNAIAATLDAAKLPLSETQATALERMGREASDADARRLAGYDARAYELTKIADEADEKDRFIEAAFGILTQEQRDALSPPAVRGRVQIDLFSSGLLWLAHMRPAMFHDKDALVAQVEQFAASLLKLDDAKRTEARAVIQDWVNGLPRDWLETPGDALAVHGIVPASRVTDAARREVVLLVRLVDALRLDDKGAERARTAAQAWVPIRVAD